MNEANPCELGFCNCACCYECGLPVHGHDHDVDPVRHDGECPDWKDEPMPLTPPIQCVNGRWEEKNGSRVKRGCTRMLILGGPFPKTPRQLIEEVKENGWAVELDEEGRRARFTCEKCQ